MSDTKTVIVSRHDAERRSLHSYVIGFGLSVVMTLIAYLLVVHDVFSRPILMAIIAGLALLQFAVQVLFFLHLSQESRPRWRLVTFLFMGMVVIILVAGSIWIINNMNYHMPSASQVDKYLNSQDGL